MTVGQKIMKYCDNLELVILYNRSEGILPIFKTLWEKIIYVREIWDYLKNKNSPFLIMYNVSTRHWIKKSLWTFVELYKGDEIK
jgi:hypothetical protein